MSSIVRASIKDIPLLIKIGKQSFIESHIDCAKPADLNSYINEKFNTSIQQITTGPENHLFGYIGQSLTIPWNSKGMIPRSHIESLEHLSPVHDALSAHMLRLLPQLAQRMGLSEGFRTIINTGVGGGQTVFHLHIHLLGGERLPGFH